MPNRRVHRSRWMLRKTSVVEATLVARARCCLHLLAVEGGGGFDVGCAQGGDEDGSDGGGDEDERDGGEGEGIGSAGAVEDAGGESSEGEGNGESDGKANRGEGRPWRKIEAPTVRGFAPRAMRMPISRVRRRTE